MWWALEEENYHLVYILHPGTFLPISFIFVFLFIFLGPSLICIHLMFQYISNPLKVWVVWDVWNF